MLLRWLLGEPTGNEGECSSGLRLKICKPCLAAIAFGTDHSLAAHRQSTAQLCQTCVCAKLCDETLSLEAIAAITEPAFQHDNCVTEVL